MGQRHQAFVIARVVPHGQQQARYRCIGAIHHQWCYGSLPLMAAARFISLARQKDNAEIIREEISAMHGCYGEFKQEPAISAVPCPFIHFLLSSAWATDLSDPEDLYASPVATLPAGMGSKDGDNNDGITVLDVTDPENISYCFSLSSKPISATQYIRVYYEEPTESDESQLEIDESQETLVQSAVGPLDSIPLIPEYHLAEAWPTEYKAKEEETPSDCPLPSGSLPLHQPLSLVDLTLRPAVEQAILGGNISKLEPFIFSKADVMRDVIRSYKPITDSAFSLLKKVIEVHRSNEVDLSGFSLSGEQTLSLLKFTPENDVKMDIHILKLSHNDQIDIKVVQQVLELPSLTALRRLVLWNTAVSDGDIIDLLEKRPQLFYRIEALIHPAFMKYSAKPIASTAFTHVSSKYDQFAQISIPYFTPGLIAQGLLDYLPQIYHMLGNVGHEMPAMAAYASEVRSFDKPWDERIVPFVPFSSSATKVKEGQWLFALASPSSLSHSSSTYQYAFARINVEIREEREAELISIRAKQGVQRKDSEEVTAVRQKYESHMYDIHDVHSFFKELELEGRPAPVTQILNCLLDIFRVRDDSRDRQDRHSKTLNLMSAKYLDQFLVKADEWLNDLMQW